MGSVPKEKAGVGSAMNDTTRQVGGAVGVALLGSVAASSYSSQLKSQLSGKVSAGMLHTAQDSLGAAIGAAHSASGATATALANAARASFVTAFHTSVLVGAVILVLGAVAVLRYLPARARDVAYEREAETAAVASVVPMGVGPVDVVPAELAADVAEELRAEPELEHERA
jgi:hypothetical protein